MRGGLIQSKAVLAPTSKRILRNLDFLSTSYPLALTVLRKNEPEILFGSSFYRKKHYGCPWLSSCERLNYSKYGFLLQTMMYAPKNR